MLNRPTLRLQSAAMLISLFAAVPLAYIVVRALGADPAVWRRLWLGQIPVLVGNTAALVLSTVLFSTLLGVGAAWLVERTDLPGRRFWRVLLTLPLAIPAYVAAICWLILLRRGGVVEQVAMQWLGLERGQLPLPMLYNLAGATFVIGLCVFPYVFLPVGAALRSADRTLEEAARLAGQGAVQVFRRVTLPLVMPAVAAGALLVGLYCLSDFGTVSMLRYRTFTLAIYQQFGGQIDRSAAAILSVVLIGLALPLLVGEARLAQRERLLVRNRGWRPLRLFALGPWRWVACGALGLLVFLALGLPFLVLGGLSLQGWLFPTRVDQIWGVNNAGLVQHSLNSLFVAASAATIASLLACGPALLAVRFPSRWSMTLLTLSKSPFALPGVIIGLGFVLLLNRWLPVIYGTLGALLIGVVFRVLPQAVAANETALRMVAPTLEQAARTLGCSGAASFRRVTIPVAAPGLTAGWILVFVTAMKELPTAMLLRPPGFDTLSVRIWAAGSESVHTQAAPPGFALIALTMLTLLLLQRQFGMEKVIAHG